MKVYTGLGTRDLTPIPAQAERAEQLGFDGVSFGEFYTDSFLACLLALEHTQRLRVGPSVAIAFPRSPMIVAYLAWNLQQFSRGRFELGLGTQVRGHNVGRFSLPWTAPGPRLREYILALRAIFDCWQNGTPLNFQGEHYTFTLMTPEFSPPPLNVPLPPIQIAAVNPFNTRLAGEVCDGVMFHPFSTAKYVAEVSLPNLEAGLKKSGRSLKDIAISGGGFTATGATKEELSKALKEVRRRISFYGSTRTYKPVMEIHGWGDINDRLYEMSIKGEWDKMPNLVTDKMLETFCIMGTYDTIVPKIKERYGWYATRVSLPVPDSDPKKESRIREMITQLKG